MPGSCTGSGSSSSPSTADPPSPPPTSYISTDSYPPTTQLATAGQPDPPASGASGSRPSGVSSRVATSCLAVTASTTPPPRQARADQAVVRREHWPWILVSG